MIPVLSCSWTMPMCPAPVACQPEGGADKHFADAAACHLQTLLTELCKRPTLGFCTSTWRVPHAAAQRLVRCRLRAISCKIGGLMSHILVGCSLDLLARSAWKALNSSRIASWKTSTAKQYSARARGTQLRLCTSSCAWLPESLRDACMQVHASCCAWLNDIPCADAVR